MSYDNFNQGGGRPGFTEQPNNQGSSNASNSNYGQSNGANNYSGGDNNRSPAANNTGGGYSSGDRSGYGGGNSSGYGGNPSGGYSRPAGGSGGYSSGGGSFKGGNSGGGWKGGNKGGFQKQVMSPEQLAALELPKRGIVLSGNYGAPESLIPVIREMADIIQRAGFAVRASSMNGFDEFVRDNVPAAEFHIPWKGFGNVNNPKSSFSSDQCNEFAKRYCPEWGTLKDSHQAFFSKNVRLVLGKNLDAHCHLAIIWSDDGVEGPANRTPRSAHAGHIAAICHACGIPVINISNPDAVRRLRTLIEGQNNHG